jgi:hypothetical protein
VNIDTRQTTYIPPVTLGFFGGEFDDYFSRFCLAAFGLELLQLGLKDW